MSIQSHLDKLRAETPGCSISAFGDLSSKLVLRSSARGALTREVLDRMCDDAVLCFSVVDAEAEGLTDRAHYGRSAMMFTPRHSVVFARPAPDADDVTLAVVDGAEHLDKALHATLDTMDQIAKDSA